MTFHSDDCASRLALLSNPPKFRPCDCKLSGLRQITTSPAILHGPQPGNPGNPGPIPAKAAEKIADRAPAPVVSLVPNKHLAPSHEEIADRLVELATRVRAGEWLTMTHAVVLINDSHQVHTPWVYGGPMRGGELVGLMEFVKFEVMEECRR